MGVLKNAKEHILEKYGFDKVQEDIYERRFQVGELYYLWATVSLNIKKLNLYLEYDCGGEVANYNIDLSDIIDDEDKFIDVIDEKITEIINRWRWKDY